MLKEVISLFYDFYKTKKYVLVNLTEFGYIKQYFDIIKQITHVSICTYILASGSRSQTCIAQN